MRIVVALGGNALLQRGEQPDADIQQYHVERAVKTLAPLAIEHQLIVTHGNGPQVGVLAQESARDPDLSRPYPFDVLGAQTQGMVGYWLAQAFENALPPGRQVIALFTRTLVDETDPAFHAPTKFVGPVYTAKQAIELGTARGWDMRPDGRTWRRVVASPEPRRILELPVIEQLVDAGALVICAGGGGVPVVAEGPACHRGVEAVVDKDLAAALLATQLHADRLCLLTDVPGVIQWFDTPRARLLRRTTPAVLRTMRFAAGSMRPKVDAVCRFVGATGSAAVIAGLDDAVEALAGRAGTLVETELDGGG